MPKARQSIGSIFKKFIDKYVEEVDEDYLQGAMPDDEARVEKCESWEELIAAWEKALHWTDQLEHGLSCMLAAVTSTMSLGDQLWLRIISPPSTGKSVLAEAITRNKRHIYAKSTLKGFYSGYAIGGEDFSLVNRIAGKTFIVKDADTILQNPNKDVILSEARDLYDRNARTDFKNGTGKNYEGVRMTMLWCGTNSIRSLDDSELGERFLDCVIMEDIDFDLEEKILMSMVVKADRNMGVEATEDATDTVDEPMDKAMALTAGYVDYLRENAQQQMAQLELNNRQYKKIVDLARYVAFLRANYSERQSEKAEREMAGRISNQLIRLTNTLPVVTQSGLDDVFKTVTKVAKDTAQGLSQRVVDAIMVAPGFIMKERSLKTKLGMLRGKDLDIHLQFMREIGILGLKIDRPKGSKQTVKKWFVNKNFVSIWENVNG